LRNDDPFPRLLSVGLSRFMHPLLIVDLEATCCDVGTISSHQMEIIEVGACWVDSAGQVLDTFQSFVRPTSFPVLTEFCTKLTSIRQADVDSAPVWADVAPLLDGFGRVHQGATWGSWGNFDCHQIAAESARARISAPLASLPHVNLKALFAKRRKIKQVGMATAMRICGLQLAGSHHRALDDALNISRLIPHLTPTD
jgi:inhibitor of KinA sporulation pathway (predicted exonuclease)